MTYERVVSAAIAETASKFKLAEALALDIPPQRGRDADTARRLEEARQAIIDAGGEPRAVETLADYRRTAQWVILGTSQEFGWLPGVSYSAHEQARHKGLTYDEFVAAPSKQVRDFRATSPECPENVVGGWTREEKTDAARALLTDPDVADEVMRAPEARSHAAEAIGRFQTKRDHQEHAEFTRDRDEPAPDPFRLLYDFRRLHRTVEEIARQVSQRGTIVSAEERDLLLEEVDWLASAVSMIRDGIRGGDLDTAISRILAEGGVA